AVVNKGQDENMAKNYAERLPTGVLYLGWVPFDEGAAKNYRFSDETGSFIAIIADRVLLKG
ncbi:MAG: hypothetical protein N2234_10650, partial [Planctomycetota bacterium]|nr:hypothetical protein [Planctomycetota bacterium]